MNNDFRDVRTSAYENLQKLKNFIISVEEYKKDQYSNFNFTQMNIPLTMDEIEKFVSGIDQYYNSKNNFVFIRGMDDRFISSQNGWYPMIAGDKPVPLGWEVFGIEKHGNKVALNSRGKYVSSENDKIPMNCDRHFIGEQELFNLIDHSNGTYSFKCNNGKYISSKPGKYYLFCNSATVTENEKFTFLSIKNLADEINISWTFYNLFIEQLSHDYDKVVDEKIVFEFYENIDKEKLAEIDSEINQIESTFEYEVYHLNDMIRSEEYPAKLICEILKNSHLL